MDNARETTDCPCYVLAGILPNGFDSFPDHVCSLTCRHSCDNWVGELWGGRGGVALSLRHYQRNIPLGDGRIALPDARTPLPDGTLPHEFVCQWPIPLAMAGWGIVLAIRQRVEDGADKRLGLRLTKAYPDLRLGLRLTKAYPDLIRQLKERGAADPTGKALSSEDFAIFSGNQAGLPTDPETMRWLKSLRFPGAPQFHAGSPDGPMRSVLVTSLAIGATSDAAGAGFGGELLQQTVGGTEWARDLSRRTASVQGQHRTWWDKVRDSRGPSGDYRRDNKRKATDFEDLENDYATMRADPAKDESWFLEKAETRLRSNSSPHEPSPEELKRQRRRLRAWLKRRRDAP